MLLRFRTRRSVTKGILLLLAAAFSGLALAGNAAVYAAADQKTFTLGRVSTNLDEAMPSLTAMSEYLNKQFAADGISVREIVVPSADEMVALLRSGEVDLVSETPLAALAFEDKAGAKIILREWKKGVAQYSSLLVVGAGRGIAALDDLKGKVVAFEDESSTSGFLVPLAVMRGAGLTVMELEDRKANPPADVVGYVFAGHEINVASLVARRIVDAGAISSLNWNDPTEVPPGIRERLEIIYTGDPVMRSVVLVRDGLPEAMEKRLFGLFCAMHETAEGRHAMVAYHGVSQYDRLDERLQQQLEALRVLYRRVADKVH